MNVKTVAIKMNIAKSRERRARRWSFEGRRKSRHAGRYMRCRCAEQYARVSCYEWDEGHLVFWCVVDILLLAMVHVHERG